LLEISKHSTIEAGEIENMKEIKEMDELIKNPDIIYSYL